MRSSCGTATGSGVSDEVYGTATGGGHGCPWGWARMIDISGANATDPQLLNQFNVDTHEFFLWEDPADPERALLFAGNASSTCATRGGSPSCPFSVWDISPVRDGQTPVTLFSGLHGYTRFPPNQLR